MINTHSKKSTKRKVRVSGKVKKNTTRPVLKVHRTNKSIYAQVFDASGVVIASSSDTIAVPDKKKGLTKTEKATLVGTDIAEKAVKSKVKQVAFDRGSYKYHGRVKALAEAARKAGLEF